MRSISTARAGMPGALAGASNWQIDPGHSHVEFAVRHLTDAWGAERAGFSARGKIDRTDFGLTWNQALEAGGVLVGNEVKIAVEVELIRQAKQAAA